MEKGAQMLWVSLVCWIVACQGVGFTGARWTAPEIPAWYRGLRKPSFNPPRWVFAPVWTTLYLLMAIAAWRVQHAPHSSLREVALAVFLVQLGLNLLWTWIFFHRHDPRAALAEIGLLWLAIALTIAVFARVDWIAAVLMAPYLLWVSFASVLNGAIARLN
jgi:benzodiazapine receptor